MCDCQQCAENAHRPKLVTGKRGLRVAARILATTSSRKQLLGVLKPSGPIERNGSVRRKIRESFANVDGPPRQLPDIGCCPCELELHRTLRALRALRALLCETPCLLSCGSIRVGLICGVKAPAEASAKAVATALSVTRAFPEIRK